MTGKDKEETLERLVQSLSETLPFQGLMSWLQFYLKHCVQSGAVSMLQHCKIYLVKANTKANKLAC